ncbi:hypothetical protein L195_g006195 [Trifolium pratense]|uniref:Uncharacterized protein n=3 Tax=Trifolium pratense TaxID=57577 RepID=A0A2K3P2X8_TRIPR|nr:uncharacterized protein LOC123906428 isoform X2 [Trifolium pratense]XP_045812282.1 uncharacterized protein LOC123906428 isoform X2 [Trifolium pratense]PNY09641.1 hypothetical protein L195_g006195 [Trifolium pratense]CAJ2645775.1 unnamed protein product [Trifolium pratense]
MILKTLMEEKQLDFNQPILSVRRFPSTAQSESDSKRKTDKPISKRTRLPGYKSELKSGPVSNPGTVPFVWEKTPGRPIDESKVPTTAIEGPLVAPKLPPGRVLKVEQQDFDKIPKGSSVTRSRTESTVSNSMSVASLDSKDANHDNRKEEILEKESSGSDNGDETYLDARDTLSRTESFFMNCSVSGMSGCDDREVQPSETFSADQQARDFMIGRFLPAAKAMASDTPHVQYASRKPVVRREQPRLVRKVESGAKKSRPLDPKWQKVLPHYAQDTSMDESEDEIDDDRYESHAPKVCGLFPRFCLLSPLQGLRVEDKIVNSAIHGVQGKSIVSRRKNAKEHARTVNYGKESQSKHDIDPHRRGCDKLPTSVRTRFESTCESPAVEKTLYVDSVQEVSSEMNCRTDHREDDFETLRKDSSIDKITSIESSIDDSKHMVVVDAKSALQPKGLVFLDSTLLVCSDKSSDDMQMKKTTNHSNKINTEKQGSNIDRDFSTASRLEMAEDKKIESKNEVPSNKISSNGLIQNPAPWRNLQLSSDSEFGLKIQRAAKLVDQEHAHVRDSNENLSNLTSLKVVGGMKNESENQFLMKLGHTKTSNASSLKVPLALPSPKAPSESWLKRTLPTVSSKNISSRSHLAAGIHAPAQTPNAALLDYRGHLRFAEELAPIPEA